MEMIDHGNICRSAMAEYIFKDMINKKDLTYEFIIDSKAVSNEEIGNDIYPLAKRCLDKYHVPYSRHQASRITKEDYDNYDYIFVMDNSNLYRINQIVDDNEHKVSLLLKDKVMKWNGDKLQHEMY